jgi:hypothetical protein
MSKKLLPLADLLKLANERLQTRAGFVEGMEIVSAELKGPYMVMRGECFFDASGNPTSRTVPAIEFYNDFAREFSNEYWLSV